MHRSEILSAARDTFGIDRLRPGQMEVTEAMVSGRDVVARMPTGHGKSLCYQLAASVGEGTSLVVSPLIALMRDQVASLTSNGISAVSINSGLEGDEQRRVFDIVRAGRVKLLYVAPEQLFNSTFAEVTANLALDRVIVDEAHCISQWGHDFRPSYLSIADFADIRGVVQRAAFTATASERMAEEIASRLGMSDELRYMGDLYRPNLRYSSQKISRPRDKAKVLLDKVREVLEEGSGTIIVYCSTRKEVVGLSSFLKGKGVDAEYYHGGMPSEDRFEIERDFIEGGRRVIVATNAFGMGIDRADVRLIVHFNLPGSIFAYLQETGRAGRDGLPAECLLLSSPKDAVIQRGLVRQNNPKIGLLSRLHGYLLAEKKRQKVENGDPLTLKPDLVLQRLGVRRTTLSQIWAGLAILQDMGVIRLSAREVIFQGKFEYEKIEEHLERKLESDLSRLEQMLDYISLSTPTQRDLIDVLEVS